MCVKIEDVMKYWNGIERGQIRKRYKINILWRIRKLTKLTIDRFEWTTLLSPNELSKDEAKSHSDAISKYLSKLEDDTSVDFSSIEKITEIEITDSYFEELETNFERITKDELFQYMQTETDTIDPQLLFPKLRRINHLFWFLHHLAKEDITDKKVTLSNPDAVSLTFYQAIEAATYFGFLSRTVEDGTFYFTPTKRYQEFMLADLEKQYHLFLAGLASNETIREILQIQLNEPLYDTISKRMVHNILVKDPNLQTENITNDDITKIINNLRYWYLGINKLILEN